jgi:hypothetical protein
LPDCQLPTARIKEESKGTKPRSSNAFASKILLELGLIFLHAMEARNPNEKKVWLQESRLY